LARRKSAAPSAADGDLVFTIAPLGLREVLQNPAIVAA